MFPVYRFSYYRFKLRNDREEINLLRKLIKPGAVVYDIGANIGFYATLLSELAGPKGKVVCFEPDKHNFRYLQQAAGKKSNVLLFQKAVSDKAGELKIYRSKLLNVDHRTYPVNNYESVEIIEAVCLDDLVPDSLPSPDVIKIDIQGYELAAFHGMRRILEEVTNLKIIAEFWPHGFKRAGTSALEFYDFLEGLGYRFSLIGDGSVSPLNRTYIEAHNNEKFEFSFNVLITKE